MHACVQVNILPVLTFLYTIINLHVRVLFSKPVAMVSNSQKVLLTDGHLLEREASRGDRENEDSVYMIQH